MRVPRGLGLVDGRTVPPCRFMGKPAIPRCGHRGLIKVAPFHGPSKFAKSLGEHADCVSEVPPPRVRTLNAWVRALTVSARVDGRAAWANWTNWSNWTNRTNWAN